MEVQLFDFRWRDEQTCEFQATDGKRFGRRPVSLGDNLSVQLIDKPVYCAGSMVADKWQPCPEGREGRSRCEVCRARERNFVFTMFDGFNTDNFSDDDLAQIAGSHVVYLAFFEKELFKIGVSKLDRKILRQLEQGSRCTLYIAQTENGVTARQIETLVRRSGIKDKVKASAKKDFLQCDVTEQEAEEILRDVSKNIPQYVHEYPKLEEYLLKEPEFRCWDQEYGVAKLKEDQQRVHSIELHENDAVSGKVVAIKGPFVVLDTGEEIVSVCMKDYTGRTLDFSSRPQGLYTHKALQNTLF